MTPTPFLADTYRRYKSRTGQFVQWLAETASNFAPVNHLLIKPAPSDKPSSTGRTKGKARSKAKATVWDQQSQPSPFYVPVKSFLPLAEVITSRRPIVPVSILSVLRDVIFSRKECAAFYKAQENVHDIDMRMRNEAHQHFISVLEDLYRILQPFCVREHRGSGKAAATDNKNPDAIANIFEYLEIEEADVTLSDTSPLENVPVKRAAQKYRMEPSDEEISFAIFCFLKDCTEVRLLVHQTWREYKQRRIPLTVAATTSNSAIEILRRLNEAFLQDFPDFDDHERLIDFLYETHFSVPQEDIDGAKDGPNYYDIGGVQMMPQTFVCEVTTRVYFKWFFLAPTEPNEAQGILSWDRVDNKDKRTALGERYLLFRVFTLFNFMEIADFQRCDNWHEDLLFGAICATKLAKKPLTWAVFAVQSFIDMHRELEMDVDRGFNELQKTGTWIKTSFLHLDEIAKTGYCPIKDRFQCHFLEKIRCFAEEDYTATYLIPSLYQDLEDRKIVLSWGSNFLLNNHPMFCGLIEQYLLMTLHDKGIEFDDVCSPALASIHLYNAALQRKFIPTSPPWADLEYVIAKVGERSVFVGERPRTLRDCYTRLALVMGVSITHLAGNARKKMTADECGRFKSLKPRRHLEYLSQYLKQIRDPNLKADVRTKTKKVSRALMEPAAMLDMLVASSIPQPSASKKTRTVLTPLETLAVFKRIMNQDASVLRFDIGQVVCRCIAFLRSVQTTMIGYVKESDFLHACLCSMDFIVPHEELKAELEPVWTRMAQMIEAEGNTE